MSNLNVAGLDAIRISQQSDSDTAVAPPVQPNYDLAFPSSDQGQKMFYIFKLVHKKKGRYHLDGICDNCLNPKTKKRERIYLINGAPSIWQSELKDILADKEYVKTNRRSITFEDGVARIRTDDENAIAFLQTHAKNVGQNRKGNGKGDFYEYDILAEAKYKQQRQLKQIEMVIKAKDMDIKDARKLAVFLGVVPFDDFGQPKPDEDIKSELMLMANNNPENFERYIGSKEVEVSSAIRMAITGNKIDLQAQGGNALWAGGKGFICKIPSSRKPLEYLTELAMSNTEEGRKFYEELTTFA